MGLKPRYITCLLLLGLLLPSPALLQARAEEASLSQITLSTTAEDLMVYLKLDGAFTEKIKTAVFSGVPTAFNFTILLDQVRVFWLDEKIAQIAVTHSIKYDNLKKEFVVRRSWKGNVPETTSTFEEAQALMNGIEQLKIISLDRIEKGSQYQLRTKAEVSKKTLPFNLHSILFFVSLWDVETDWYIIDFTF